MPLEKDNIIRIKQSGGRKWYTIWRREDDAIICFGQAAECMRMLDMDKHGLYLMIKRCREGTEKLYDVLEEDYAMVKQEMMEEERVTEEKMPRCINISDYREKRRAA